jgi:acylphosphatase
MTVAERKAIHVIVRGRVQGVGFRAFVEHHALSRGIEGWVRNRRDGTLEAVFAGDPASVEAMIVACKTGPPGSRVDDIEQRDATEDDLIALRRQAEIFSCLPTV